MPTKSHLVALAGFCVIGLLGHVCAQARQSPLERQMWRLVNRDRAKHHLKPLILDARMSAVARAHSRDMREHNFVGHRSNRTGTVKDRFFNARIAASKIAENVALHSSVTGAEAALMKSPGHRKNLLNPDYTHIGIGIVRAANGQFYVTQNFAVLIPQVDPARAKASFIQAVNRERLRRGVGELVLSQDLEEVSAANCEAMKRSRKVGYRAARVLQRGKRLPYREYRYLCYFRDSLDSLSDLQCLYDTQYTHWGVGIIRNDSKNGFGMSWITIILATKR